MKGARDVFRFLGETLDRGERAALVTLTGVEGSSARAPGSLIGVGGTGATVGSLSGGCVEAAIVAEAQRVIADGTAAAVRFGIGSPYIDIRLPCGGGLDLLFTPLADSSGVAAAADLLGQRRPVALSAGLDGSLRVTDGPLEGWDGDVFTARYEPDLRIVIAGHGAEALALMRQAQAYGADVIVLSPDAAIADQAGRQGMSAQRLIAASRPPAIDADRHSAVVLLFHDHEWEEELLLAALATPAFFIGAMGSRATHRRRCELLAARGVAPGHLARIVGPIGSIPMARDPDTLAVSILAQIVGMAREAPTIIAQSR